MYVYVPSLWFVSIWYAYFELNQCASFDIAEFWNTHHCFALILESFCVNSMLIRFSTKLGLLCFDFERFGTKPVRFDTSSFPKLRFFDIIDISNMELFPKIRCWIQRANRKRMQIWKAIRVTPWLIVGSKTVDSSFVDTFSSCWSDSYWPDISYCEHFDVWCLDRVSGEYADTLEYLDISG